MRSHRHSLSELYRELDAGGPGKKATDVARGKLVAEKRSFVAFARQKVGDVQEMAKRREEESMTLVHDPNDKAVSRWWLDGWLDPNPLDQPERTEEDKQALEEEREEKEREEERTKEKRPAQQKRQRRSPDDQDPSGIAMPPVAKFGEKYMGHAREESFKQYRKHAPASAKEKKRRKQQKDPGLARRDVQAALFLGNKRERQRQSIRRRYRSSFHVTGESSLLDSEFVEDGSSFLGDRPNGDEEGNDTEMKQDYIV